MIHKAKGLANIDDVFEIMRIMGKRTFIIDGTLLGFYREKGFIEHDTDIDFGVFAEEWTLNEIGIFIYLILKRGFNFWTSYGKFDKYFEFAIKRYGIKIDFFFYRKSGDKRIFHAFRNGGNKLPEDVITYEYPAELIEELQGDQLFDDVKVITPKHIERILELKYGKDWQTPKKNWDWADSPCNKV